MPAPLDGLFTALGVGLLIGLMRERRHDDPASGASVAGLRTHALASLAGAVAWHLDLYVFLVLLAVSGALVTASYRHTAKADVGLTSEFTLALTILLGALAMDAKALAAGLGVATAILLHLRKQLHHLGRELISEQEVRDGLLLAAAALIVMPMLPTEPIDPWRVIVPSRLWKLVVLVMAAGVGGQVALRIVGARFGLPVAGFFAGFASSTAATASYGQRVRAEPHLLPYAVSAALFAVLATVLLLVAVLSTGNATLLRAAAWPLTACTVTLLAVGAAGLIGDRAALADPPSSSLPQAFKLSHAVALAAFVAAVLLVSAILDDWVGQRGAVAVAVVAGMVELQGAALAIGQLADGGRVPLAQATWGIVLLLAASGLVKSALAFGSGGRAYGARVAFGLGASVSAAALAAWLTV